MQLIAAFLDFYDKSLYFRIPNLNILYLDPYILGHLDSWMLTFFDTYFFNFKISKILKFQSGISNNTYFILIQYTLSFLSALWKHDQFN